jgi:hypothetical protein
MRPFGLAEAWHLSIKLTDQIILITIIYPSLVIDSSTRERVASAISYIIRDSDITVLSLAWGEVTKGLLTLYDSKTPSVFLGDGTLNPPPASSD